jgi:hypothetical protein
MLMQRRWPLFWPPEQVMVIVAVVSTAAPVKVLMLPNTIFPMLTVHVCAKAGEQIASTAGIIKVVLMIFHKQKWRMASMEPEKVNWSITQRLLVKY